MSFVKKINFDNLINFSKDTSDLSIVKRDYPAESKRFFEELLVEPFNANFEIFKKNCYKDVEQILDLIESKKIKKNSFFKKWLYDIAKICEVFCDIVQNKSISLSLETSRSCKRLHIDNVPIRLLVTYYGKGTEWFPFHACDYSAYYRGESNEKIIKDNKERKFINAWDVAIFKGQKFRGVEKGILHKTPDEALLSKSLLMRLDNKDYLSM